MWWKATSLLLLWLAVSVAQRHALRPRQRIKPPARRSSQPPSCGRHTCYPVTGNLLIGRESKLVASSTCGSDFPERYCNASRTREDKTCMLCDSRPQTEGGSINHDISNIISRNQHGTHQRSWWQSGGGVENVSIQLDLESEFHFTDLKIVFGTVRPAAMLIERSSDYGKTWHVFRYFAHKCNNSFPGVMKAPPRVVTDVVCESRYSRPTPLIDGELVFRVLPRNVELDGPYSNNVHSLFSITNLRVNFTKLHTFGDKLPNNKDEINEQYFYAITSMNIYGSCACYGHASRCFPSDQEETQVGKVYSRCECTHNTTGVNCEYCEELYNDLPWKPAQGGNIFGCRLCNCNNHATSCHFDAAVYEISGRVSGGVCDNCRHNTMGINCERCLPFYYRDYDVDVHSPESCKPCDCEPGGSMEDTSCDSVTDPEYNQEAGRCLCKPNVEGKRCDTCKDGFWKFDEYSEDGCEALPVTTTPSTITNISSGCALPVFPKHGNYKIPNYAKVLVPGDMVEQYTMLWYSCKKNYDLQSEAFSACQEDNTWLSKPLCKKRCVLYSSYTVDYVCYSAAYVTIPCQPSMAHGTFVVSCCKSGHFDLENEKMTCRNGRWDTPAPSCKPDCGLEKSFAVKHIVNAPVAKENTFPWHVGIYQNVDGVIGQICGGSILHSRLVISAAHCFYNEMTKLSIPAQYYLVAAEKFDRSWDKESEKNTSHVQKSEVLQILLHDRYRGDAQHQQSDMALLVLKTPFTFTDTVRAICFDLKNADLDDFHLGTHSAGRVAGWGLTERGLPAEHLRTLTLPVIDLDECHTELSKYRFTGYLTWDKFCAGYLNGSSVCNGDSGGGLVFPVQDYRKVSRWFLRGVVSNGPLDETRTACRPDTYTAFTRVFFLRDWLKQQIRNLEFQREVYKAQQEIN